MQVQLCIVVEPDDPGFHAYCPALPGLHVSGDTEDEALNNAVEAATAYVESILKHGDPLPVGCVKPTGQVAALAQRVSEGRECVRQFVVASP